MPYSLFRSGFVFLALLSTILSCSTSTKTSIDHTGEKFEPADGNTLFILGQADQYAMRQYIANIQSDPYPAGFAFYTSLSGNGAKNDMNKINDFMSEFPKSALQLAIWTGERRWGDPGYYLREILRGEHDGQIVDLAEACKDLDQPIFIRFGYEFDGFHNAYPPTDYVEAYQYFVDMMRDQGVDNVAFVWHSWGVDPYYGSDDYPLFYPELSEDVEINQSLWYPGDDYVDWFGLSIFGTGWGNVKEFNPVQYLVSLAKEHDKPLMIAESAAIKTSGSPDDSWVIPNDSWFVHLFDLIEDNPETVKAFTYINVDWEADNPQSTWGDTRIQEATPEVQGFWDNHLNELIHASDTLFRHIGYK